MKPRIEGYSEEIINFLPDPTLVIDSEGVVIAWNREMERLTNVPATAMIGRGDYECGIPFYQSRKPLLANLILMPDEEVAKRYHTITRDGDTLVIDIFIPTFGENGAYLWAKASPLYDPDGNVVGAIETVRDITDRVISEQELQKTAQRLARINNTLTRREAILNAVTTIASGFLQIQDWITFIPVALEKLGQSTDMSAVFLHKTFSTPSPEKIRLEYRGSWFAEDQEKKPDIIRTISRIEIELPWSEHLLSRKVVSGASPFSLEPYHHMMELCELQSYIIIPIFSKDTFWGCFGFINFKTDKQLSDIEIEALLAAADILGAALYRAEIEEMFHKPVESSSSGVFVIHKNKFKYSNPGLAKILGCNTSDLKDPQDFLQYIHPDDEDSVRTFLSHSPVIRDTIQHQEFRVVTAANHIKILDGLVTPIEIENEPGIVGTVDDITKRREAEYNLLLSEQKYRDIFNNTNDAIYLIEVTEEGKFGKIRDTNMVACKMLGYPYETLVGMPAVDINASISPHHLQKVMTVLNKEGHYTYESEHRTKDAITIPVEIGAHIFDLSGERVVLAVARNIADRKIAEARVRIGEERYKNQILQSLNEKETLLREIHHRVKNNMQIITSLLRLQEYKTEDPILSEILRESRTRILSMAMLHEKLYRTEDFARIPLAHYLDQLSRHVEHEFEISDISADVFVSCPEEYVVDIDMGIPMGLIINELVTNSMKYAFTPSKKGLISVSVTMEDDNSAVLIYRDNGKGLPPDFHYEELESLGMTLIHNLVNQHKGMITLFSDENGFTVTIRLPPGKIRTAEAIRSEGEREV